MNALMEWFARYNRREQTVLLAGAIGVALYLLWQLLLVPLAEWREQAERANRQAEERLGRVELLAARLEQARERSEAGDAGSGNLSALVDSSLQSNDLSMSGFQPGSSGQVRVRLDEVPYDRFMRWLYEMEFRHEVQVVDFSMAGTGEEGRVTVNIRLQHN